ncbi:MAG: hypothetical protein ACFCAD_03320 [Pleurocapsa sp.]
MSQSPTHAAQRYHSDRRETTSNAFALRAVVPVDHLFDVPRIFDSGRSYASCPQVSQSPSQAK